MPDIPVLTFSRLRQAESELSAADPIMAKVIAVRGPIRLPRKKEPPFHVLAVSIINQQLSQKVADIIESRVAEITDSPFAPAAILQVPPDRLRAAGLSGAKVRYLHEIAARTQSGDIPIASFPTMEDEEIISALQSCPGIGRWTAEMFLMFAMRRPDVVSAGDAALCRAARILYGKKYRGGDGEVLLKAAKKWQPWRTVASRYLWLSLRKD